MQRWLAKDDFEPPENLQQNKPAGIAFNFLTMLRRSLWEKVGGMSREYRWGSHYDDTDFAHKIKKAAPALEWVDDVVIHTRENGARAPWVKGGAAINKKIFGEKWLPAKS
jgi:GT2 family glycosyltransferase